jgi:hypothetical protein
MSLQRWPPELLNGQSGHVSPEFLGRCHVSALVDRDSTSQPLWRDADGIKEPEEEEDQLRVAVDEGNPLADTSLTLRALAPVRDGSSDQKLARSQIPYLGQRSLANCLSPRFPPQVPVGRYALSLTPADFFIAQSASARQISDPERDRALGDAELCRDLDLGVAIGPQLPGSGVQGILRPRP